MRTIFICLIFVAMTLTVVDYGTSYAAIQTGRYGEGNSLVRWYVEKPVLAIPIITLTNYGAGYTLDGLWKDNKTVAWIAVGGLILLKGYVLIHNARVTR